MIKHKYGVDYSISFRVIDINDSDILGKFECENKAIREFARTKSLNTQKDVTYLFIDEENNTLVAFCSVCCTGISVVDYDYDGEAFNSSVPSIEIDFFAVDERYRNIPLDEESKKYDTLSNALFLYMIEHIRKISTSIVGATHICLYSVPRAKNFYKRCDFVEFEDYMNRDEKPFLDGCIPMFYLI